jgi:hypothetical protein
LGDLFLQNPDTYELLRFLSFTYYIEKSQALRLCGPRATPWGIPYSASQCIAQVGREHEAAEWDKRVDTTGKISAGITAVNLISSQVAGAELNRGKSASSDQIGLVRFSFSFLFLLAFCSFSRHSYDTYMTPAVSQVRLDRLTSE